jgi:G3E family GTPase
MPAGEWLYQVTVVDAAGFLPELRRGDELAERGLNQYEGDKRTVSDLLIDQIEFADVLLLTKTDLAGPRDAGHVEALLSRLNPSARILRAVHGEIPLREVLGTGLFDLARAQQAPGWVAELNGVHVPKTEQYGISSLVFRASRPFHPGRLWRLVTEDLDRGQLATRLRVTGIWSQAGAVARFEPAARAAEATAQAEETGHLAHELVFIGTQLRPEVLRTAVGACLITDGERHAAGEDQFPEWDTGHEHLHAT